jgi:hypothetical protein
MDTVDIGAQLEALAEAVKSIRLDVDALSARRVALPTPMLEAPPAPSPDRRPRYLPTDWPRVGGRARLPASGDLFLSQAYCDVYEAGEGREIYVGACIGLAQLASQLRMPLFKVSSCGLGRLGQRMRELGRDRYGSEWNRNGEYVVERQGFEAWFPSHIYTDNLPAPNSPVAIGPRALTVKLPRTMAPELFDAAFDAEVRKAAIDAWVMRDEGRRHCAFLDLDPAIFQRSTAYSYGSSARGCPAKEIVVLRIHEDTDQLVTIVEQVILRHLGLIP